MPHAVVNLVQLRGFLDELIPLKPQVIGERQIVEVVPGKLSMGVRFGRPRWTWDGEKFC